MIRCNGLPNFSKDGIELAATKLSQTVLESPRRNTGDDCLRFVTIAPSLHFHNGDEYHVHEFVC